MQAETRHCKNCNNEFTIEPDDFGFYEKINVPAPTFCPDCRLQRRLAWRNDLTFYNRECDLCHKKIVSLHAPQKKFVVYCNTCWWSDNWDPKTYGRDFDFSRSFFEQFRELQNVVPLPAMFNDNGVGSVNSEYATNATFTKNAYMGAMTWYTEDCMYFYNNAGPETHHIADTVDIFNYSELIYDSVFLEHSYNCRNAYYSTGLTDCSFVYDCKGCSNCFMCVNLRQKSYCILNKQYTKEEYEKIITEYRLDTYSGENRAKEEFSKFLASQPRRFANIRNSVNSTGDGLFNCKNCKDSSFLRACENLRFVFRGNEIKDSYDLTPAGMSEQCYEGLTPDHDFQVLFSIYSLKSQELAYVENCHSSKHLFGCSAMKHGQYSILNKQYSKEEYIELKQKIIEHMKKTGEWGEFFPAKLSHFGYNETMAQEHFPLEKEEALKQGYTWFDLIQRTTGKETLSTTSIPNALGDTTEKILDEILACSTCKRNYRIAPEELRFHQRIKAPLSRECFFCRNSTRLKIENPMRLWHRSCMCQKEGHDHSNKCPNEFETCFAPERPEIVFCENCYNKEIL
jgi:hypothetical protein